MQRSVERLIVLPPQALESGPTIFQKITTLWRTIVMGYYEECPAARHFPDR